MGEGESDWVSWEGVEVKVVEEKNYCDYDEVPLILIGGSMGEEQKGDSGWSLMVMGEGRDDDLAYHYYQISWNREAFSSGAEPSLLLLSPLAAGVSLTVCNHSMTCDACCVVDVIHPSSFSCFCKQMH